MSDAETYRARLEQDPSDTEAFIGLCELAEQDNDYDYLSELYRYRSQVTENAQEKADMLFKAATVYMQHIGDQGRALEALLEGFELDPAHAGIGQQLDALYRESEDWESVLHVVEKRLASLEAVTQDGIEVTRSDLHQQAGEIHQRVLGDQSKALSHYKKAFELDKTNLLAIYSAREIYYALGKYKNAAKLCGLEAKGEQDPVRKVALYRELGHLLTDKIDDPRQGVVALKRALKLDPKNKELKIELAGTIAKVPPTEENEKDRVWAAEYLLRDARAKDGEEGLEAAKLAFCTAPSNSEARELLMERLEEDHSTEHKISLYKEMIEVLSDLEEQAPMIRKVAHLTMEEFGDADAALEWLRKIEPLGRVEDIEAIAKLSQGMEKAASQPPAAFADATQEEFADAFEGSGDGLFGSVAPPEAPPEGGEEMEPLAAKLSDLQGLTGGAGLEDAFDEALQGDDLGLVGAVAGLVAGDQSEESIERLKADAEEARLAGNEELAEQLMVQVLDQSPDDAKATTYLERRYRARGDWLSLKGLLLKAAHIENLSPAIRTVRLKEAARIDEEELKDIEGAILAWKMIRDVEPDSREALDSLARLLSQTENWDDLLDVVREEAEGDKSKAKRIDAYRRMADIYSVRLNDVISATEAYNNILELQPDDARALEALDEIYLREQQHELLVPLIRRRAENSRNRAEKRDLLLRAAVLMRERLEQFEEAYQLAIEILKLSPGDDAVLELMESIDEEAHNWERLVGVMGLRAKAASGKEEKAVFLRKKATLSADKLGDFEAAIEAWADVLALVDKDPAALEALADIYKKSGLWNELVDVLRKQLDNIEDAGEAAEKHREIAHVLDDQLGDEDAAVKSWFEVLAVVEDAEALGALARHYERKEEWSELSDVLGRMAPLIQDSAERADALFRQGQILESQLDNRKQAVEVYREVLNSVLPEHMATLVRLREILSENKEYAEAATLLERQISQTQVVDELKGLLVLLGDWRSDELSELPGAMEVYERALHFDKEDDQLIGKLDQVYETLEEWEKLLKLVWSEYRREESEEEQLNKLLRGGRVCEDKAEDFAKAWAWYRQAFDSLLHLDATMPAIEEAAERMGSWKELVELYGMLTRSEEDDVRQASWWKKMATVFQQRLGDSQQALEAVLRAFGLTPDDEEMLDQVDELGAAAEAWDRLATVYAVLTKRREELSDKIALLSRYARILLEKADKASDAFDVILKAFEFDPRSAELLAEVEEFAEKSTRYRDLVRVYDVCAKLAEDAERKCELRLKASAVLRDKLADSDGALLAITEVLKVDPYSAEIREKGWSGVRGLEETLSESEKGIYWVKVIELYRTLAGELLEDADARVKLLHVVAEIRGRELGDFDAAFEVLREAQQLDAQNEATRQLLGEIASEHGKWNELAAHYSDMLDEAFERDDAMMYHRMLAQILRDELDRVDEASEHYWQIIQLDSTDVESYESLISHYQSAEKWNDLVNILERRIDIAEDDEQKRAIFFEIADVWENKIGNRFEAKEWYDQVLTLWPDDEQAKERVEAIRGQDSGVGDGSDFDDDIESLMSLPVARKREPEEQKEEVSGETDLEDGLDLTMADEDNSDLDFVDESGAIPMAALDEQIAAEAEVSEESLETAEPIEELEEVEEVEAVAVEEFEEPTTGDESLDAATTPDDLAEEDVSEGVIEGETLGLAEPFEADTKPPADVLEGIELEEAEAQVAPGEAEEVSFDSMDESGAVKVPESVEEHLPAAVEAADTVDEMDFSTLNDEAAPEPEESAEAAPLEIEGEAIAVAEPDEDFDEEATRISVNPFLVEESASKTEPPADPLAGFFAEGEGGGAAQLSADEELPMPEGFETTAPEEDGVVPLDLGDEGVQIAAEIKEEDIEEVEEIEELELEMIEEEEQ